MIRLPRQEFTIIVLSVLVSLASCTMRSNPGPSASETKAAREAKKQKGQEYLRLCEETRYVPLQERNAKGPVYLVQTIEAYAPEFSFYMTINGWPEAVPKTPADAKNILCIIPDKNTKQVDSCVYEAGLTIPVYSRTTLVTLIELESHQKIGQTEFVHIPECPREYLIPQGPAQYRELRGGKPTDKEVIDWAKKRWSP
jgi:hypothetical protein